MSNQQITVQEKYKQRLISFGKALNSAKDACNYYSKNPINNNAMALIQGFEFSFELSWKTLKYFFEYKQTTQLLFARDIIKKAFNTGIIKNGKVWIDMLEDRNNLSHVYDADMAQEIVKKISTKYIKEIENLYNSLKKDY